MALPDGNHGSLLHVLAEVCGAVDIAVLTPWQGDHQFVILKWYGLMVEMSRTRMPFRLDPSCHFPPLIHLTVPEQVLG